MLQRFDDFTTRSVRTDELAEFFGVMAMAFGEDRNDDDLPFETLTAEPERSIAVFDGEQIVATAGAFTFDMAVPGSPGSGGLVPTAGVTYVTVRATHRRRGLLSGMMRGQLLDIHDRGEPLAALWASESVIYGRFGYGLASQLLRVELDRVDAKLRTDVPNDPDIDVQLVQAGDAQSQIDQVEQALVAGRPGTFVRDKRWIESLVQDPPHRRHGLSSLQCVVASRGGEPVGYALYRTKPQSVRPYGLPDGELAVVAQAALDPAANAAITRLLLSVDLMRRVRWWSLPVDTPLPHLLQDPRQARTTLVDQLHIRVVDVAAALAARRYAGPTDVVIEVRDALCPWNDGRWRLTADTDTASCERTTADADVTLPVETLGAVYLGGPALTALAAAGRAEGESGALRRLSAALHSNAAPWCPVVF